MRKPFLALSIFLTLLSPNLAMASVKCEAIFTTLEDPPVKRLQVYRPLSELAKSLGLNYSKVEETKFPLRFGSIQRDTARSIHTSEAVIRRFYSENLVVDITSIEHRAGMSQEFLDLLNEHPSLPKIKNINDEVVKRVDQFPADEHLHGTTFRSQDSIYNEYYRSLSLEQRSELSKLHNQIENQGKEKVQDLIYSYVRFAHQQYARRGWGEQMLKKLEEKALDYMNQSTYITVRALDPITKKPGAIVGNIRVIRSAYSKVNNKDSSIPKIYPSSYVGPIMTDHASAEYAVKYKEWNKSRGGVNDGDVLNYDWQAEPVDWNKNWHLHSDLKPLMMEELLGVQLPRPAVLEREHLLSRWFSGEGEILEPGAFAIDKQFNAPVFAEILTHMMLFVYDPNFAPSFNKTSRAFYTYNDYPQLYSTLGFRKLGEAYKNEFNEKTKKEHSWWLLRATSDDILAAVEKISELRKNSDFENLERIKNQILSIDSP